MEIEKYLKERSKLVEEALDEYLPPPTKYPSSIHEAMRYSVFNGGKYLRPILTMAAAEVCQREARHVLPTACAIELIHAYSLIHDDLPALDNADYRRGKPSCHKVFGEAVAILAGDALLPLSFNLIIRNLEIEGIEMERVIRVIKEVSEGIGSLGMVGGQVVDLETKLSEVTPPVIQYIHSHKTGLLFRLATRCGAILAGADEERLKLLTLYGEDVGFAFQIVDDLLDLKSESQGRANYPSLFGIAAAKDKVNKLIERAISLLNGLGEKGLILEAIARFIARPIEGVSIDDP